MNVAGAGCVVTMADPNFDPILTLGSGPNSIIRFLHLTVCLPKPLPGNLLSDMQLTT